MSTPRPGFRRRCGAVDEDLAAWGSNGNVWRAWCYSKRGAFVGDAPGPTSLV